MQFACEKCGTRYGVPDEKVRGKRVRTKCRKCGSDIIVEGPPGPPGVAPRSTGSVVAAMQPSLSTSQVIPAPASSKPHKPEERWTVALSRTNRRRLTTAELVQGYESGKVTNAALVWKAGMEEWQSPFDIPALALALQARGFGRPAVVPNAEKELARADVPEPTASVEDWDEEVATRVVDNSIRFPGRPSRPAAERSDPPAPVALPPPPSPPAPEPVKFEPHWPEEDDEETSALPLAPTGAAPAETLAPPPADGEARPKAFEFDDEATAVIAPDRARELLEQEAAKNKTLPPPPGAAPPDDDEATQVFAADRARAMLAARPPAPVEPSVPRPPDRPPRQPPRIPARKPRVPSPPSANRGPSAPPANSGPSAPPADRGPSSRPADRRPSPPPAPSSRPHGNAAPPADETPTAKAPSAVAIEPPRPRTPSLSDAETEPLPAAALQKATPPAPKPAAGAPPLASLAPPKPSTVPPPPETTAPPPPPDVAPGPHVVVSPPPPEPPRPEEPSVVVAEPKPAVKKMPEAALKTMPRQNMPAPPGYRSMQHEPTRVVRVVKKKNTGLAFWTMLIVALLAAAAGGFVVSQMFRDHRVPSWLKK